VAELRGRFAAVRQFVARRFQRDRVRFVSVAVLGMSLLLLAVAFATAGQGQTAFGSDLGADYAGFYAAAALLNRYPPDRLYDFELQNQLYHETLPGLEEEVRLPYVHPPFVALALRPLARLPYAWSFALWLVPSASLYLAAVVLILKQLHNLSGSDRTTALLLALSFEPFIMECWLGGQLSAFGLFCIALAWYWQQAQRPLSAGVALGFCLYKPTLLVLLLPLLVIARRWRMLAGFGVAALGLAGVSVLTLGWRGCLDYVGILLGFARLTGGESVLRTWKYVDLNAFFHLLLGDHPLVGRLLVLVIVGPALGLLAVAWWRLDDRSDAYRNLVWASTLTWTVVANLYVGVYDSVLVVPAALLAAEALLRREGDAGPALPLGLQVWLILLYSVPWVSQHLARWGGFQPYTLVLLAFAVYLQAQTRRLAEPDEREDRRVLRRRAG
jgi:hypothetical protein